MKKKQNLTFFDFSSTVILQLKRLNRMGTYYNFSATERSFKRFLRGKEVRFNAVDHVLLEEYQAYLQSCGLALNSISFYMRNLRAIYNRAVDEGLTVDRKPFRHVFTGVEKTRKRALSLVEMRCIRKLDLSDRPTLEFSRDVFLFLFYCRGMSFVDAAFLKKTDVQHQVIRYRRQKTGQLLQVRLIDEISSLIDRYTIEDSPYLLPIIVDHGVPERKQYSNALHRVNRNLKEIAKELNLPAPLTTYVSRHSWASIANTEDVPVKVISAALGHDSILTTQIYLDTIDVAEVDSANDLIVNLL